MMHRNSLDKLWINAGPAQCNVDAFLTKSRVLTVFAHYNPSKLRQCSDSGRGQVSANSWNSSHTMSHITINWPDHSHNTFHGSIDIYSGITIDLSAETNSHHEMQNFAEIMHQSLQNYTDMWKLRAVWLKIPISAASLVPIAASQFQFNMHHCRPDYIMMAKWLVKETESKLPPFCTASIGCGALVYDQEEGKVLIVVEKYILGDYTEKERRKHFKIPTGTLNVGEDIAECVQREVLEETGIKARTLSLLGFRELHKFRFDTDDFFFCFVLEPANREISIDQEELMDAFWMPVEEYLGMTELGPLQASVRDSFAEYLRTGKCIEASDCTYPNARGKGTWYGV